jgi:peptidoglycan/xylan/chitin deacetylase (PgdA/CDA1 family)
MGVEMRAVLTFHSIDERPGPLSYSPRRFSALLDALSEAKLPVRGLDELLGDASTHGVALTFDDGIATVSTDAMPILRERRIPAHVFVISRWVGGESHWPQEESSATPFRLMDWDQLEALQSAGLSIEGHTASHPDVRSLSDTQIEAEMEEADSTIERRLGRRPRYFAYPFGYHNAAARAVAKKRYAGSFTTRLDYLEGPVELDAIPRLDAHYLRSPALVRSLPSKPAHAYMALRRALRRFRGH